MRFIDWFLGLLGLVRKSIAEADRDDAVAEATRQQMESRFADYEAHVPNDGVLLAIENLPGAVASAIRKIFPTLGDLSGGTITSDQQAKTYDLDGIATLTLWPFPKDRAVSIASTTSPQARCTIDFKDGCRLPPDRPSSRSPRN